MAWHVGPLLGFDTETTGVDVFTDRVVTAATVLTDDGSDEVKTWLVNPGVEIPEGAAAVHGITTEHAASHGREPREALWEISQQLYEAMANDIPVVGFNVAFDLTLMESELARHGLPTLASQLGRPLAPIIDPLVLDRGLDRYRRGKRTLEFLCAHYEVATGTLHDAGEDVRATLGVLGAIAGRYAHIVSMTLDDLHTWQVGKHREWAESFNSWRQTKGFTGPGASPHWPVQLAES